MTMFKFRKPYSTKTHETRMSDEHPADQPLTHPPLTAEFADNEAAIETDGAASAADPVQALHDELATWKDKSYRLAAEIENVRKRAQRDQDDAVKYGLSNADHPPGVILYVMETGYKLHDRLLRPARVAVTKAPVTTGAKTVDVSA